jgi:hypothetical protein
MCKAGLCIATFVLFPAFAAPQGAPAPEPIQAATTAGPAKPPPWYSVVTVTGSVDAYYQVRFDAGQNQPLTQRAFDQPLGFSLGNAMLSAAIAPAPAGLRIDLVFGNTSAAIDSASATAAAVPPLSTPTAAAHVLQGYVAVKLAQTEFDLGRFLTSVGAEVATAKDNWLYSRGLLYNLQPFTNTGLRLTVPVASAVTVQAGVVDGWDVTWGPGVAGYAGKTGEAQIAYSGPNSTAVSLTTSFGPNPTLWSGTSPTGTAANTSGAWRTIVDLVATTTLEPFSLSLNLDWANEDQNPWYGASLMARWSLPKDFLRITVRGEYVVDEHGVRFATGSRTNVWELTGGLSYPVGTGAELRAEVRYDKSSKNIFTPPSTTSALGKGSQATGTLAALAWF